MSVDLSEFRDAASGHPSRCAVARAFDRIDAEQAEKLRAALADPDISGRAISVVVSRWGVRVGDQSVTRHRRGVCLCPTD